MEQKPITENTLRQVLREERKFFREEMRDELNDRFNHYEKRMQNYIEDRLDRRFVEHELHEETRHKEIMEGFGEVISTVNDHIDERLNPQVG